MFDRTFSAALTFCMLAAGTLAIGSAMLEQPEPQVVHLERVVVTGKRVASAPVDAKQVAQAQSETEAQ
ncbi:MAG: hypothetical protein E6H58_14395 [Betaproteobacteria bacterium]|nr:MAG: hypothetical protein E6H58_14395 [Betaproteobacteria bacterium]